MGHDSGMMWNMELKPKKIISRWTNNKSIIIWKYIDNNTWDIIRITWVGFHIGASEFNASFLLVESFSQRLKTHIKNIKWKTLLEIREPFNFGNFMLWEWFKNFHAIYQNGQYDVWLYRCWWRNVLVTTIRCWLTIFLASGTISQKRSPTLWCHQHRFHPKLWIKTEFHLLYKLFQHSAYVLFYLVIQQLQRHTSYSSHFSDSYKLLIFMTHFDDKWKLFFRDS